MPQYTRSLHWHDLPETACEALVSVSTRERDYELITPLDDFVESMKAGGIDIGLGEDGDRFRYESPLRAKTPERLRAALATVPKDARLKILEIGLGSKLRSPLAEMLALAAWPEALVEALGRRYDSERRKRSRKAIRHMRRADWNADDYSDQCCCDGMLLPVAAVRRLQSVVHIP